MAIINEKATGMVGADRQALENIFGKMQKKTIQSSGISFGENIKINGDYRNVNNIKDNLVNNLATIVFDNDLRTAAGEASTSSNNGIAMTMKKGLAEDLKKEFLARGKNILSPAGIRYMMAAGESAFGYNVSNSILNSVYASSMPNDQQLLLMALAPSIIKPIHNKVVKSIVNNAPEVQRVVDTPFIRTSEGKIYDYYSLLNDPIELNKIMDGGQPKLSVTTTLTDNAYSGNLIDIYNQQQKTLGSNALINMKTGYDFIMKGVTISGITITGKSAKEQKIKVEIVSTGDNVQSGQVNNVVAVFTTSILGSAKAGLASADFPQDPYVIEIFAKVLSNGTVSISSGFKSTTSEDLTAFTLKVKDITFDFVIPSKGAENPTSTIPYKTTLKNRLVGKATHSVTLNQQLADDYNTQLNIDLIDTFSSSVIPIVNNKKDGYLMNLTQELQESLRETEAAVAKFLDRDNALDQRRAWAYESLDINSFNYGYTDFVRGTNLSLSNSFFNVMNKIDTAMNPEEKNFSVVSSSNASKWVEQEGKANLFNFSISGELSNTDIAGIKIPYAMKALNVMSTYSGTYIATNFYKSANVNVQLPDKSYGFVHKHRFNIYTRFEEKLDSVVFFNGLERITTGNGNNNPEYVNDLALNYEQRFGIVVYNKAAAVVDLTEGINKTITVK